MDCTENGLKKNSKKVKKIDTWREAKTIDQM